MAGGGGADNQIWAFNFPPPPPPRRLRAEKLLSDVESHVFKKMEVGHAYSKIKCGTDPTDSLETHSIKVLYKNSIFES